MRPIKNYVILAPNQADFEAKRKKIDTGDTNGFLTIQDFVQKRIEFAYQDAKSKLLTVKWKTVECQTSDCWCLGIEPAEKIYVEIADEYLDVVNTGSIYSHVANHIVKLHNSQLK